MEQQRFRFRSQRSQLPHAKTLVPAKKLASLTPFTFGMGIVRADGIPGKDSLQMGNLSAMLYNT
ncbi:MAG: hypothetical protein KDA78_05415 [Planctomycetaceae bacterium]|nr:hypothetical protein [Planctomycetaceae bacterium]